MFLGKNECFGGLLLEHKDKQTCLFRIRVPPSPGVRNVHRIESRDFGYCVNVIIRMSIQFLHHTPWLEEYARDF